MPLLPLPPQSWGRQPGGRIQHTAFLNMIKSQAQGALNHRGPATICWGWQSANHQADGWGTCSLGRWVWLENRWDLAPHPQKGLSHKTHS